MRITVDESLSREGAIDLEVRSGTPVGEALAEFGRGGAWCGTTVLNEDHPAGRWPLVAGARLSAHPRPAYRADVGLHLAAIAGPDAGAIIPINGSVIIGAGTALNAIRDAAMDAAHASMSASSPATVRVRDLGTVNGTGVWALRRGTLVWRGRRRSATVRIGDVIAAGHSLLELRRGPQGPAGHTGSVGGEGRALSPFGRRLSDTLSALGAGLVRRETLDVVAPLDATARDGWLGDVTIRGDHAADVARAVILARGRRPPDPSVLAEPWLGWLPPAGPGDGAVRIGAGEVPPGMSQANEPAAIVLTTAADHIRVDAGGRIAVAPLTRVRADTADSLARAQAGRIPEPLPHEIRWADAAALAHDGAGPPAARGILTGVWTGSPVTRWEMRLDTDLPHALIAGMPGSGKTTCLATLATSLATKMTPDELEFLIVCPGVPGPLGACLDMPHVRIAAINASADEAIRVLSSASGGPRLTLVIADDLHAYGVGGRTVAEACERLIGTANTHLLLATTRPAAVLSPRLRAAITTTIAMRAASDADSEDAVGVADAARIPPETPGAALVRTSGQVRHALVALPIADPLPAVMRHGHAPPSGRHLATRALPGNAEAKRRSPGDRDPPAPTAF